MTNETNFRKDIVASVKENFGKRMPLMNTIIPVTVRLAEISTADQHTHWRAKQQRGYCRPPRLECLSLFSGYRKAGGR